MTPTDGDRRALDLLEKLVASQEKLALAFERAADAAHRLAEAWEESMKKAPEG